mgnify:CR=1 FL=1
MKTRHIVFLVIALILTAAALICALLSNTFVRGLNETQDKENDSVGEAVGTAAGALVFVIFGLVFLVVSFLLALPAMFFAIVNIRIVSAATLAVDAAIIVLSITTVVLLN